MLCCHNGRCSLLFVGLYVVTAIILTVPLVSFARLLSYYIFLCFSVLSVLALFCAAFFSRSDVILAIFLPLPYEWELWWAIKPGSTHHLLWFQEQNNILYQAGILQLFSNSSFLYVCWRLFCSILVFLLFPCFPRKLMCFPQF